MKVGWFLHTPFPSSEIHRTLPSRSDLLRSVLAADLVGYAHLCNASVLNHL
jgi:trehalose 6-phosphate synthase/phosphatase